MRLFPRPKSHISQGTSVVYTKGFSLQGIRLTVAYFALFSILPSKLAKNAKSAPAKADTLDCVAYLTL